MLSANQLIYPSKEASNHTLALKGEGGRSPGEGWKCRGAPLQNHCASQNMKPGGLISPARA